jgi:hypothetical protein
MTLPANGNNGAPNKDKAYFCPTCGGADVTASLLAGGNAQCEVCSWKGQVEDLLVHHFSHGSGSQDEIARQFFLDIRNLFARTFATELGALLMKWGFLETVTPDSNQETRQRLGRALARYIGVIAQSAAKGIFETRAQLEKERIRAEQQQS